MASAGIAHTIGNDRQKLACRSLTQPSCDRSVRSWRWMESLAQETQQLGGRSTVVNGRLDFGNGGRRHRRGDWHARPSSQASGPGSREREVGVTALSSRLANNVRKSSRLVREAGMQLSFPLGERGRSQTAGGKVRMWTRGPSLGAKSRADWASATEPGTTVAREHAETDSTCSGQLLQQPGDCRRHAESQACVLC